MTAIAPFEEGRQAAAAHITAAGAGVVTIHVATPLRECARRDVKGLYAAAARGVKLGPSASAASDGAAAPAKSFDLTGVSHPYEVPARPDVIVDGEDAAADVSGGEDGDGDGIREGAPSVSDGLAVIVAALVRAGYVRHAPISTDASASAAISLDASAGAASLPTLSSEEAAVLSALKAVEDGDAESASQPQRTSSAHRSPWLSKLLAGGPSQLQRVVPGLKISGGEKGSKAAAQTQVQELIWPGCTPQWDVLRHGSISSSGSNSGVVYAGKPNTGSVASSILLTSSPASSSSALRTPRGGSPASLVFAAAPGKTNAILQSAASSLLLRWREGKLSSAAGTSGAVSVNLTSSLLRDLIGSKPTSSSSAVTFATLRPSLPPSLEAAAAKAEGIQQSSTLSAAAATKLWSTSPADASSFATDAALSSAAEAAATTSGSVLTLASHDMWTLARWAAVNGSSASSTTGGGRPGPAVFSHPSLLPYLSHLLSLDPCAAAVVALPPSDWLLQQQQASSADGGALLFPSGSGSGSGSSDGASLRRYLKSWSEQAAALARAHGPRVMLVDIHFSVMSQQQGQGKAGRAAKTQK